MASKNSMKKTPAFQGSLLVGALAFAVAMMCSFIGVPNASGQFSPPGVNPGAATLQEFQKRIADFVRLHKQVEAKLTPLKTTAVSKEITDHQQHLARGIVEARSAAKQGDIFSDDTIAQFRRLIGIAMSGPNGANIRTSLAHAEPVRGEVGVNTPYPAALPLQSSPPTLLLNLPKLPPELDYRIVGNALILRDVVANLVIDFMPGAIPPEQGR
jgi:hypothetical protein